MRPDPANYAPGAQVMSLLVGAERRSRDPAGFLLLKLPDSPPGVDASHGPRPKTGLSMEETPSSLRGRALRPAQGREFIERGRGEGVLKLFTLPFIPSRRGRGNELFLRRETKQSLETRLRPPCNDKMEAFLPSMIPGV